MNKLFDLHTRPGQRDTIIYFDTSAVNYVSEKFTIGDAIATRGFQEVRGRRWSLSPITIWEILSTTDEQRREELIYFSQHLFSKQLLPSPEELLVAYISQGSPLVEKPRALISNSPFAVTWRDICLDTRKTFILDHEEIRRRTRMITSIVKDLHRLTRNRDIALNRYEPHVAWDISLAQVVTNLTWVKKGETPSDFELSLYKISAFYILFLLCAEIGVDPVPIRNFWAKIGIESTMERFRYILKYHETLVHRGPIAVMAYMTLIQARKKFSRGIYWDSLHSFYLTYVDLMLSEDEHFVELRDALPKGVNALKIQKTSELHWTFHERENPCVDLP
uniref:Uncharacterized protein n=1 Tax=Candidatus Kentrum sp. DK TaxID=2126562 RepID=A0A450T902_9GAMM|nr:MAG: hypothetical protein BECKDK2373C_GA0170839_110411 [Candidatus Kentron sp. DK]